MEQQALFQLPPTIVNVASVKTLSPFRYPGGKTWLVPTMRSWLSRLKKRPKRLIEPFAGGAIIGLTAAYENLVDEVILVELDPDVASVWEVIFSGDGEKLAKKIVEFDFNETNVHKALEASCRNSLQRAFLTILKNRVYHGGILAPGSGLIKNGENGKGLASRWYPETLAQRISILSKMKGKVNPIQGDGLQFLKEIKNSSDAVFVDPPYTAGGKRAGRRLYSYSELDHQGLFQICSQLKCPVMMTYDRADEVIEMARSHGFDCSLIPMKNTHHAKMTELLISKHLNGLGMPLEVVPTEASVKTASA